MSDPYIDLTDEEIEEHAVNLLETLKLLYENPSLTMPERLNAMYGIYIHALRPALLALAIILDWREPVETKFMPHIHDLIHKLGGKAP